MATYFIHFKTGSGREGHVIFTGMDIVTPENISQWIEEVEQDIRKIYGIRPSVSVVICNYIKVDE